MDRCGEKQWLNGSHGDVNKGEGGVIGSCDQNTRGEQCSKFNWFFVIGHLLCWRIKGCRRGTAFAELKEASDGCWRWDGLATHEDDKEGCTGESCSPHSGESKSLTML